MQPTRDDPLPLKQESVASELVFVWETRDFLKVSVVGLETFLKVTVCSASSTFVASQYLLFEV